MIYLKSENEIDKMRIAARLVSQTLGLVSKHIEPGVTTGKLDRIAEEFIDKKDDLIFLSFHEKVFFFKTSIINCWV